MAEDLKFKFEDGKFVNRVTGEAIPDDEPVMLFRARDRHALAAICYYRAMLENEGHQAAVERMANLFEEFQADHPDRMREPQV